MGTAKRERQKANRQIRLEEMARQAQKDKRKRGFTRWAVAAVAAVVVILLLVVVTGKDDKKAGSATSTTEPGTATSLVTPTSSTAPIVVTGAAITGDTPCPAADGSAAKTVTFEKAPSMCIDAAKTYTAVVETNKGNYTVALDAKNAPKTVNNFVVLARYHYFDETPCHRIIQGFMAQCGDPSGTVNGNGNKYPGYTFADENKPATASYPRGTLAMANAGADTNGSQYFTMLKDYPLTANYSIFGKVTDGLDTTLPALEAAADPAAPNGTPTKEPVRITKVTITES